MKHPLGPPRFVRECAERAVCVEQTGTKVAAAVGGLVEQARAPGAGYQVVTG